MRNNAIIQIYNKIRKYRWCHYRTGKYYSNKNKWFTIPPIIFASATSFVILDDDGGDNSKANHYLSACMSMLSAMISGVSMHLGFHAKSECHLMSATHYDELVTTLEISIKFNKNLSKIEDQIDDEIIKIKRRCKYQIPQWVFNEYKELPDEDKYYYDLLPKQSKNSAIVEINL